MLMLMVMMKVIGKNVNVVSLVFCKIRQTYFTESSGRFETISCPNFKLKLCNLQKARANTCSLLNCVELHYLLLHLQGMGLCDFAWGCMVWDWAFFSNTIVCNTMHHNTIQCNIMQ